MTRFVPVEKQSYSAIIVLADPKTGNIMSKNFLSPSGEPIIEVEYQRFPGGGYRAVMIHAALKEKLTVLVHDIVPSAQSDSVFDPVAFGYKKRRM